VNRLGTHGESEVLVRHDTVSRRHAEIEIQGRKARVRDLESTNGTFVNDVRLEGAQELQLGDRIRIADVELLYQR
jgi:pSer/pThr/pTyr-binding forkhead associated (FHA) protein